MDFVDGDDFRKPQERPLKRKSDPESVTGANHETLDIFACVGIILHSRHHYQNLHVVNEEFNEIADKIQESEAEFTVKIAKEIVEQVKSQSLAEMVYSWDASEAVWAKLVNKFDKTATVLRGTISQFLSVTKTFLSVWDIKNIVLKKMMNALEAFHLAIQKCNSLESSIQKEFHQLFHIALFEQEVSMQMVYQQRVLIVLSQELFNVTRELYPKSQLRNAFLNVRMKKMNVCQKMLELNIDINEISKALASSDDRENINNKVIGLSNSLKDPLSELLDVLDRTFELFNSCAELEIRIDKALNTLLIHRIQSDLMKNAVTEVIKILIRRGCGMRHDKNSRYRLEKCFDLRREYKDFQGACRRWECLAAVKKVKFDDDSVTLWSNVKDLCLYQ